MEKKKKVEKVFQLQTSSAFKLALGETKDISREEKVTKSDYTRLGTPLGTVMLAT